MKQVCFVTGGSRGIGRAVVERFKSAGVSVAACATTLEGARAGGPDLALACDVADQAQVKGAIAETVQKLGGLDVLVNNAGAAGANSMDPSDGEDEHWHRVLDVNLNGVYYACKHAAAAMPDGRGRIINIGSTLSMRGVPDQLAYAASKHAVLGLTRALAHRLAPRKITANIVCPGWVRTDMAAMRMDELGATEAQLLSRVPLGRFIEPGEVAAMCLYLAGPDASGVTGQSFVIDGGSIA